MDATREIVRLSTWTNQWIENGGSKADSEYKKKKEELKNKRIARGQDYFFGTNGISKDYWNFCEAYKQVAMEYGKRRADKFAAERAKTLALRERGYAIFIEGSDGKRYVCTFPEASKKAVLDSIESGCVS